MRHHRDGARLAGRSGVSSVTPVILQPGQQLRGERGGVFRVVEWAGEGSYARVYQGEGPKGPVALKLAKREVPGAETRLRWEREAHRLFVHTAFPCLQDEGDTEPAVASKAGVPWLARHWVNGVTLRQRIERDRCLPLVRAVPLLVQVADAIVLLHAEGWSHGDLRPDNILLEAGTHQAFLLDLGEARPVETSHAGDECAARADPRSGDLRQLGALLAWSLTGVDPAADPDRLSRTAGYHPVAVQLWREIHDGRLARAGALRDQLSRLAKQLGVR
jgi:serine/threonine protein kinase